MFARYTGEMVAGEFAIFRNQLDDYVFPSSRGLADFGAEGGRPRFQYTNEDAVFKGAEGDIEISVSRRLVFSATASYVRAEFTSMRDAIPVFSETDTTFVPASNFPPLIPPLNGQVGLRYERRRYFAAADVRWAARQDRVPPPAPGAEEPNPFDQPTTGYHLLHAVAGLRWNAWGKLHTLTLQATNLLDAEWRDHLSRIKAVAPQPGRNVELLYRLEF